MSASFACACSILYSDYDHRFATATTNDAEVADAGPPAFVTANATVLKMATASGDLFFAVGDAIERVSEDGGAPSTWWTGPASDRSVVDLASNGTDTIIWSFGSSSNIKNSLFLGSPSSPDSATTFAGDAGAFADFVAATSVTAWSSETNDRAVAYVRTADGSRIPLVFDAGAKSPSSQARALALDHAGVSLFVTPARFLRFASSGTLACTDVGFTLTAPAIATGPNGSPTFLIYGSASSGDLLRYDTDCPTVSGASTKLDSDISSIVTDSSAVYWCTSAGNIFRAGFTENSGTQIGATVAEPSTLAVSDTYLYAAVGSSIFRFDKSP